MNYEKNKLEFYHYLLCRKMEDFGFQRYGYFKKLIKFYFGTTSEYCCRKLFNLMIKDDLFYCIDAGCKSYLYKLKNEESREKEFSFTVIFE